MAADALAGYAFVADPAGYHLWLDPGPAWHADDFVRAARASGVAITPAEVFVAGRGHVPSRVRLGLTAAADRAELARGLDVLRGVLDAGERSVGR